VKSLFPPDPKNELNRRENSSEGRKRGRWRPPIKFGGGPSLFPRGGCELLIGKTDSGVEER